MFLLKFLLLSLSCPSISPQGSLAIESKLIFPFVSKNLSRWRRLFTHTKKKKTSLRFFIPLSLYLLLSFGYILSVTRVASDLFFPSEKRFFFLLESAKMRDFNIFRFRSSPSCVWWEDRLLTPFSVSLPIKDAVVRCFGLLTWFTTWRIHSNTYRYSFGDFF